ncbi:hypothetical protein [Flavobacterium poyangense]|uniref:hypothetical protein n=1 Tax=Flavobacterium poyangense TaxID=2204302 RepID=UPI0014242CF4|nr:hypothetical protein [Flavobacterium sp. JXAS1]
MKKDRFFLTLFLCLFVLIGCVSTKEKLISTYNSGGYTVVLSKDKLKNLEEDVIIRGHVYDVKTGKPLSNVQVTSGCFKFQTTSEGEYSFRSRNLEEGFFYVEAVVYPYLAVETDYIDIYNRKEVVIDFYLAESNRPLIECEGVGGEWHKRKQDELNNLK